MVEFYRDSEGRLRFRATAGGHGGGVTSTFDGLATDEHTTAHPREHAAFLLMEAAPEPVAEEMPPEPETPASEEV